MTSTTNGGPAQPTPQPQQAQPQLNVLGQYVKDFSFENPNAPRSLGQNQTQPGINVGINVALVQLAATDFEVALKIEGKAEAAATVMFAFELTYAGIFRIQNVPQEHLQPLLMIECPRLLFPFAREMISTAVRNGGFAPLLLDPIDFVALYQQRLAAAQAEQGAAPPTTA
jgi:preprotein translocase subunit SecB